MQVNCDLYKQLIESPEGLFWKASASKNFNADSKFFLLKSFIRMFTVIDDKTLQNIGDSKAPFISSADISDSAHYIVRLRQVYDLKEVVVIGDSYKFALSNFFILFRVFYSLISHRNFRKAFSLSALLGFSCNYTWVKNNWQVINKAELAKNKTKIGFFSDSNDISCLLCEALKEDLETISIQHGLYRFTPYDFNTDLVPFVSSTAKLTFVWSEFSKHQYTKAGFSDIQLELLPELEVKHSGVKQCSIDSVIILLNGNDRHDINITICNMVKEFTKYNSGIDVFFRRHPKDRNNTIYERLLGFKPQFKEGPIKEYCNNSIFLGAATNTFSEIIINNGIVGILNVNELKDCYSILKYKFNDINSAFNFFSEESDVDYNAYNSYLFSYLFGFELKDE